MKLLGLQKIDGGLAIALPSGTQILVALPADRQHAARLVGERILALLDDPAEPHATQSPAPGEPGRADEPTELDDSLAAVEAGIEAGRLVWRTLQFVSRGRR